MECDAVPFPCLPTGQCISLSGVMSGRPNSTDSAILVTCRRWHKLRVAIPAFALLLARRGPSCSTTASADGALSRCTTEPSPLRPRVTPCHRQLLQPPHTALVHHPPLSAERPLQPLPHALLLLRAQPQDQSLEAPLKLPVGGLPPAPPLHLPRPGPRCAGAGLSIAGTAPAAPAHPPAASAGAAGKATSPGR